MLTGSAKSARPAARFLPLLRFRKSIRARRKTNRTAATISTSSSSRSNKPNGMTPSTPSIGHIHALQSKLDEIFEEGLDARFARHARTNALVHDWVRRAGFDFFAEEGFRSKTLTCVKNSRGIDVLAIGEEAARKTSPRHRSRLRPDQRQDLPPLEHGRRNRGNGFASAHCLRRRACHEVGDEVYREKWTNCDAHYISERVTSRSLQVFRVKTFRSTNVGMPGTASRCGLNCQKIHGSRGV